MCQKNSDQKQINEIDEKLEEIEDAVQKIENDDDDIPLSSFFDNTYMLLIAGHLIGILAFLQFYSFFTQHLFETAVAYVTFVSIVIARHFLSGRGKPSDLIGSIAWVSLCVIIGMITVGPAGIKRHFSSWFASAYGTNWLVVQYAQNGNVINHWELTDKSIGSESNSDGIFFIDDNGDVVHLSGHYVYIQVKSSFETVRTKYLKLHGSLKTEAEKLKPQANKTLER